jgi:hypothetical protein
MDDRSEPGGCDFMAFAQRAQYGDSMVYARGDTKPPEAVRAMRSLVDAGVLHPVGKREGDGFLFMVQRGRADIATARGPSRGRVRRARVRKTSLSMVFDMIVRAARRGEPCPTNEELAAQCGLPGKLAASYRVRRLVAGAKLAVEDHSPWGRRVATVLAGPHAGAKTCAGPI